MRGPCTLQTMLNHMIGDGTTYYDVQHLLSCAIKGVPAPRLNWVSGPDSVMVPPHYNADDRFLSLDIWQEQCGVDFMAMMKNPRVVGSRTFPLLFSSSTTALGTRIRRLVLRLCSLPACCTRFKDTRGWHAAHAPNLQSRWLDIVFFVVVFFFVFFWGGGGHVGPRRTSGPGCDRRD